VAGVLRRWDGTQWVDVLNDAATDKPTPATEYFDLGDIAVIAVRVATTTNGTLATAFANGQTVDGVVLATGNRILIKNQTTGTENGVYTVNASGAPTRATDYDSQNEVYASLVYVALGTTNAGTIWRTTNSYATSTPGANVLTFDEASDSLLSKPSALTGISLPGAMQMWTNPNPPKGWLVCDGRAVDRPLLQGGASDTYRDLYSVIGTSFGVGDGSTTFNLPNLVDQVPTGASGTKALGTSGGVTGGQVTLAPGNLPNHTHTVPAHDHGGLATASTHRHIIDFGNATPGTVNATLTRGSVSTPAASANTPVQDSGSHNHTIPSEPQGTSGNGAFANNSFNILNPWQALNFIIKY